MRASERERERAEGVPSSSQRRLEQDSDNCGCTSGDPRCAPAVADREATVGQEAGHTRTTLTHTHKL